MGLRDGDRVVDEEEEASLSFAVGVWAADGWRGIMFSPGSRDEGASMLAREKSGSSKVLGVLVGAMAVYDGSWGCVKIDGLGLGVDLAEPMFDN